MIVSQQETRVARSETEHMIEAESPVATDQPMIAEKPARRVANHHIGMLTRARPSRGRKRLVIAPEQRPRARDADPLARDLSAAAIVQDEIGLAQRMPWGRSGINQVAKRVIGRLAQTEEQPRRKPRRAPGVRLRLALVGECGVEHMRAETRLRGVTARAVLVAKQSMQPAVGQPPVREVIDPLPVAVTGSER